MRANQTKADRTLHLKPLSIEQRNAIDLLIVGKSDQEVADLVGVSRQTIHAWRTSHLRFRSELEQARGDLWRHAAERLRGMMAKALENIAQAIEDGDTRASFELLKAVGLHHHPDINQISDWRMESLIRQHAEAQAQREGLVRDTIRALVDLPDNPAYANRVQEISDALWAEYTDASNGAGPE
jgi:transposase